MGRKMSKTTFGTNSSEIWYSKVVLGTKFARFDFLSEIDFSVDVLVSGMSFLALARNLSSGSEPDFASY